MKKTDCEFCSSTPNGVKPISESEHFYVTSSLGQIVPGYLLINTKEHYLSLSQMPNEYFDELKQIQQILKDVMTSNYAAPIFFEHGAVRERQGVCCVDHAHLHCVPLGKDILKEITKFFTARKINDILDLVEQQTKQTPYYYYESISGEKYIVELYPPYPPSQFIRQLVAIAAEKPDMWDWRFYPTYDLCKEVHEKLTGKIKNEKNT